MRLMGRGDFAWVGVFPGCQQAYFSKFILWSSSDGIYHVFSTYIPHFILH
jgi:hypothetical protein